MYYFSFAKKGRHYHLLPNFIFGYSKTEMCLFTDIIRLVVDIQIKLSYYKYINKLIQFYFLPMIQLLLNVN